MPRSHCNCESSLCDHTHRCTREPDAHLFMEYVGETCSDCAMNMIATGGSEYIKLVCEDCDERFAFGSGLKCHICLNNLLEHNAQMAGHSHDSIPEA